MRRRESDMGKGQNQQGATRPDSVAPDFKLQTLPPDQFISLSELRGRPVILAFYPADWSPECGDQLALYNELLPEFQSFNAAMLGISVDGYWRRGHPRRPRSARFKAGGGGMTKAVLLDMWAPWCGPRRMMAPVIDELAAETAGRVRVAKLNVDENPVTAARFNARSIPTLLALKAGREGDRIVGAQPKSEIARRLKQATA